MIELRDDGMIFTFPEIHREARVQIDFQRTLRIPDDDREYALPPGLGRFPVRHVDDYATRAPGRWIEHGGVMLPMYQSEALWINFAGFYPFAIKVAAGRINAVTGKTWDNELHRGPQDYVAVPGQPWLDGYCVEKGIIRQFVAMPLGSGYSAEEQITGDAEHGGIQIIAYPLKREVYERRGRPFQEFASLSVTGMGLARAVAAPDMALAPGGRMRQEIFEDEYELDDWDTEHSSRCFVHIANSMVWQDITTQPPPTVPPTAREYTRAGLPWFDYYDDNRKALDGSSVLDKLKSVAKLGEEKGDVPLPENESVEVNTVIELRKGLKKEQVREGRF